ncbi:hypothetical protein [Candidatus Deianiraea vastatrix]|uniref:Uncharacterized protein n=1 Tax=Candidatus Deianiraea vastatrix TaxID=2163644 RepID=A0A5B8XD55_9RICK|nr:hypothetical protein [Candidatus Deianiraea vastatrix]QED23125.1 hypothetical protein Deia_00318 [Candidatus Deianiraea vastatrix]QED23262.1 hypothetical protein Deia_00462 [Candidatus Deianiraea vastatrix]
MLFICKYLTFCLLLFAIFCNKARSDDLAQNAENGTQLAADQADGGFVYDDGSDKNQSKPAKSATENRFVNSQDELSYIDSDPYSDFQQLKSKSSAYLPKKYRPNPRYGVFGHGKLYVKDPTTANVLLSFAKYNVKSSEFNLTPSDELKIRTNDTSYAPTGVSNNAGSASGTSIGLKYIDHLYFFGPTSLDYGAYIDYDSATSNVDRYSKDVGGASTITKFTYSGPHLSAGAHLGITLFDRISIYGFAGPAISRMQTFGASGYDKKQLSLSVVYPSYVKDSTLSKTKVVFKNPQIDADFNQDGVVSSQEKDFLNNVFQGYISGKFTDNKIMNNYYNTNEISSSGILLNEYYNIYGISNFKRLGLEIPASSIYNVNVKAAQDFSPYFINNGSVINFNTNGSFLSMSGQNYATNATDANKTDINLINTNVGENVAKTLNEVLNNYIDLRMEYEKNPSSLISETLIKNIETFFTHYGGSADMSIISGNFSNLRFKLEYTDDSGEKHNLMTKLNLSDDYIYGSKLTDIMTLVRNIFNGYNLELYDNIDGYFTSITLNGDKNSTNDDLSHPIFYLIGGGYTPGTQLTAHALYYLDMSSYKPITNDSGKYLIAPVSFMTTNFTGPGSNDSYKGVLGGSILLQGLSDKSSEIADSDRISYNFITSSIFNSEKTLSFALGYNAETELKNKIDVKTADVESFQVFTSSNANVVVSYDILSYLAKQQTQYSLTAQNNYMELSSRNLVGVKYGMGAMLNLGNYFSIGVEYANYSYNYKDSPSYIYDFAALNGSSVAVDVYKGLSFDNSINMKTSKVMLMVNLF